MRNSLTLTIAFTVLTFHVISQCDTSLFKINSSSKQSWMGGFSWAHGTSYTFNITFLKDVKIRFDSVWINTNHAIPIKNIYYKSEKGSDFEKDQKFIMFASDNYSARPEIDEEKKLNSKCPIDFNGDAVIRFYIKRKVYYYIVSDIQILPTLEYP